MCINYSSHIWSVRLLRRNGCNAFSPNRHILFINWNEVDLKKRLFLKESSKAFTIFICFCASWFHCFLGGRHWIFCHLLSTTPFDNYLWNQTITEQISLAIDQGLKFKQVYMVSRSGELSSWGTWGWGTGSISCEMSAVKVAFEPEHTRGSRFVSKLQQQNVLVDATDKWNSKG